MAQNLNPVFALTPRTAIVQISTANTNRDGSGTLGTFFQAGPNGARLDCISIKATGTTTAGMIRLFLTKGGSTRLWKEIPVSAITPSGTVAAFEAVVEVSGHDDMPMVLEADTIVKVGTHNAETFNVIGQGGDF